MLRNTYQQWQFLPDHAHHLEQSTLAEHMPGTVVRDFDALLRYIHARDFRLTAAHQLPLATLPEINRRLTYPIEHGFKRPQQKTYPHIHGLYLLVRASGLTYVDDTGKTPMLRIDESIYQAWQRLNYMEHYGSLLEAWLIRGRHAILGEFGLVSRGIPNNFDECASLLLRVPAQGLEVADNPEIEEGLRHYPGVHNLGLLELFGIIQIQRGSPEPGKGWRIQRIQRTGFGEALFILLYTGFFRSYLSYGFVSDFVRDQEGRRVLFGVLQPVLQPFFPQCRNLLSIPEWRFREGVHLFKVSFGRMWRRIAIPADSTLDVLASAILDAIGFDHDHLYEFVCPNRFGLDEHFWDPEMRELPFATEVRVGDVPLRIGYSMIFHYDFGDNWGFEVALEQVDTAMPLRRPVLLESHDKPPEQYRPGY